MDSSLKPADVMTDTISVAEMARNSQGSYEMEVTFGGEADLQLHYKGCKKNPGHLNFVPVGDFCVDHLPAQYQDPLIVDFVRAHAERTVLLYVNCVSDERPDVDPFTRRPFPFSQFKGSTNLGRTGTGFIWQVDKYTEVDNRPCDCESCASTQERQKEWGQVLIETATHVVFDQQECDNTKCYLDYDTSDTELEKLPALEKMSCVWRVTEWDKMRMSYKTHDMKLVDRLEKVLRNYDKLHKAVYDRYKKSRYRPLSTSQADSSNKKSNHKLTILVSHPHGLSKMVTVGEWTDIKERGLWATQYIYNAQTCPGSSGARVYILGDFNIWHVHKGSKKSGLNQSGFARDYDIREFVHIPASKIHLITGKDRKKLKKIQRVHTKANLDMCVYKDIRKFQDSKVAGVPDCRLCIQGLLHNVSLAKKAVEDLLDRTDDSSNIGEFVVEEIVIPASKIHLVSCNGEEKLKSLMKRVGMYLIQDTEGPTAADVKLCVYGLPYNVQSAKEKVEELMAQKVDDVTDPKWYLNYNSTFSVDYISETDDSSDEEENAEAQEDIEKEQETGHADKLPTSLTRKEGGYHENITMLKSERSSV